MSQLIPIHFRSSPQLRAVRGDRRRLRELRAPAGRGAEGPRGRGVASREAGRRTARAIGMAIYSLELLDLILVWNP